MKLDLPEETLEIKFGKDTTESLTFPSACRFDDYILEVLKGERRESDITVDFFCELGMCEETAKKLILPHMKTIATALSGAEEKKS